MKYVFVETSWFTQSLRDFFPTDQDYARLQDYLTEQPDKGDVIEGSGGLRKLRWADKKRGKGKRSGCRVLYLHLLPVARILLVEIYGKDEQDDFSADDLRVFKKMIEEYKATFQQRMKKRK